MKATTTKTTNKAKVIINSNKKGYRVYRITDDLREAIKTKRGAVNGTNRQLIEAATIEKLPVIVKGLISLGLVAKVGATKRPVRWQPTTEALSALKLASTQTNIAASKLLLASLSLLCEGGIKKTRRGTK